MFRARNAFVAFATLSTLSFATFAFAQSTSTTNCQPGEHPATAADVPLMQQAGISNAQIGMCWNPSSQAVGADAAQAKQDLNNYLCLGRCSQGSQAISGLDGKFAVCLDKVMKQLRQQSPSSCIQSAFRDNSQQLCACGGNPNGSPGTCAPVGKSYHQKGLAADLSYPGLSNQQMWTIAQQNGLANPSGLHVSDAHHIQPIGGSANCSGSPVPQNDNIDVYTGTAAAAPSPSTAIANALRSLLGMTTQPSYLSPITPPPPPPAQALVDTSGQYIIAPPPSGTTTLYDQNGNPITGTANNPSTSGTNTNGVTVPPDNITSNGSIGNTGNASGTSDNSAESAINSFLDSINPFDNSQQQSQGSLNGDNINNGSGGPSPVSGAIQNQNNIAGITANPNDSISISQGGEQVSQGGDQNGGPSAQQQINKFIPPSGTDNGNAQNGPGTNDQNGGAAIGPAGPQGNGTSGKTSAGNEQTGFDRNGGTKGGSDVMGVDNGSLQTFGAVQEDNNDGSSILSGFDSSSGNIDEQALRIARIHQLLIALTKAVQPFGGEFPDHNAPE